MARSVFQISSRSTTQAPADELYFTDRLAADYSTYGDPEATAIAAVLAAHATDPTLGALDPIITFVSFIGISELPGFDASASDVTTGVVDGIGPAYFYSVTTRRPDRTSLDGTVIVKSKLRDPAADAWDSVTTYFTNAVILHSGHNWKALSNATANLNKEPGLEPDFWVLDDISTAERAVDLGIATIMDPAWDAGVTYGLGDYVSGAPTCYKSAIAGNVGNAPGGSEWTNLGNYTGLGIALLGAAPLTL